jgi:GNAT superfamily N-acetyltransferase
VVCGSVPVYDLGVPAVGIRRADANDADGLSDVWLGSRHAAIAHIPRPVHTDAEVREWISSKVLSEHECWLAHSRDGETIAMLVLSQNWIEQLYVLPDFQGSGIGSALVELAKSRSPGSLQLWTFETNVPAQRFYERHGFVCVERTDGAGNEEQAPDLRYVFSPPRA